MHNPDANMRLSQTQTEWPTIPGFTGGRGDFSIAHGGIGPAGWSHDGADHPLANGGAQGVGYEDMESVALD